ncbi:MULTISPECIES: AtpZ/AtpI family protein [Thalassoglobus]|uniref:F0F1-ATPase subunit (ATPase_gene1) n=1 Tax=Thalassoglobus polymorphus TaxID=2527994 RepID=A0A517QK14_9PLAN|nr:AtpZ/AtpI family protein [Thalassoglobus polymorphus]QDT31978.1 Putative F0F1-ATPase subunit (ATPase_gene1) [Thalassoglobus polymorphus]
MSKSTNENHNTERSEIERQVAAKEARRLRAQSEKNQSVWFGLGMMGLVGWSVAIPALIGVSVGVWIDTTWRSPYSFALMLLLFGIFIGCLNAWKWVERERSKEIPPHRKQTEHAEMKGSGNAK